jgi:hypothetical protein
MADKSDLVARRQKFIRRQIELHKDTVNVRFRGKRPEGSGAPNRDGMPRLPVGQHEVKNWPVLDLGEQPHVPLESWKLEVGGLVENPSALSWNEFMALPQADDVSDFHCVTTCSVHQLRLRARLADSVHDQPSSCTRARRRCPAGSHVGRETAATRARRTVPPDHAEAVRLEGREVDPQDRVSRRRSQRLLGSARLLEHR